MFHFQEDICEPFLLILFTVHQVTALVYIKIDTCIDLDSVQKDLLEGLFLITILSILCNSFALLADWQHVGIVQCLTEPLA